MKPYNIVLAGVGGQGVITVGKILVEGALREGKNAVMSEVHGMAQRGGNVISEVRIGDVLGPIIPSGGADLVLGFELIEPLRYPEKFGENTVLVVNNDRIMSLTVLLGEEKYPETEIVIEELKKLSKRLYIINATKLAQEEAGSALATNMVMLGAALAVGVPISKETIESVLEDIFKGKILEINKKALELGYQAIKEAEKQL